MQEMTVDADDMFMYCMWNDEEVDCDDIMMPVWTFNGLCLKLNPNASRPLVSTRPGSNGGFFGVLRTSVSGHSVSELSAFGFKVLLHHMFDYPDVYSKGLMLSPGFTYHVAFVTERIQYLPYPYKAQGDMYCEEYPEPKSTDTLIEAEDTGLYSVTACVFNRAFDKATKTCGCNNDNCTLYQQLTCFEPEFNHIYNEATKTDLLGCAIPCTIRSYRPVISQARFPSPDMPELNRLLWGNTSKKINSDESLGLSLFFDDLILREQLHEPVYSTLSLMGMLGGNMGLLLGASLLTLAETIEFFMYLIWKLLYKGKEETRGDAQ